MSKVYLHWAGVYLKVIALTAVLMLLTDMFHTASLFKPGHGEGTEWGDALRGRNIISSTRVNGELFSFASCNERGFIHVILKTCNTCWIYAYYKYAHQHYNKYDYYKALKEGFILLLGSLFK